MPDRILTRAEVEEIDREIECPFASVPDRAYPLDRSKVVLAATHYQALAASHETLRAGRDALSAEVDRLKDLLARRPGGPPQ